MIGAGLQTMATSPTAPLRWQFSQKNKDSLSSIDIGQSREQQPYWAVTQFNEQTECTSPRYPSRPKHKALGVAINLGGTDES